MKRRMVGDRSSDFTWNEGEEYFHLLTAGFNVGKAKALIREKPRDVDHMNIEGVSHLVSMPITNADGSKTLPLGIAVSWTKIETEEVDLNLPIILCQVPSDLFGGDYIPIDGWHRIAKAKLQGVAELPCVVLTKEESDKVASLPRREPARKSRKRSKK